MDKFGLIRWEFTERSKTAVFLDLTTTIGENRRNETRLYEKPLNLHLFLPPHSAHPKSVLKGLIMGSVLRICKLTSDKALWPQFTQKLFTQLIARGFKAKTLRPQFQAAK